MSEEASVTIKRAHNGPYLIANLDSLQNSKGDQLEAKEKIALCRCGGSANKPFCDGSHWAAKFSDPDN